MWFVGQLNQDSYATREALGALQCIQFKSVTLISIQQVAYVSSQIGLRSLAVILYLLKYYTCSKFSGKPLL